MDPTLIVESSISSRKQSKSFNVFGVNALQPTTQDPRQVEQASFSSSDGISLIKMQYLGSTRNDCFLFSSWDE